MNPRRVDDALRNGRPRRRTNGLWTRCEGPHRGCTGNECRQRDRGDPTMMGPIPRLAQVAFGEGMCWPDVSLLSGIEPGPMRSRFNHVLKSTRSSTHGCQHMVERPHRSRYDALMQLDPRDISDRVVESGRKEALVGVTGEPAESLAVLQFADFLRRSAERLSQASAEAARHHGASWREIGQAVGGITPQGAEHRFSPAAKERRAKASKMGWTGIERRASVR